MAENNEEVVVDEVVADETAKVEETEKVAEPSEIEQKAMKMGWTPKDQFKGSPDKWRPADEFVERGENMLPIIKAQVKRQDREIAELKETLQKFGEYHTKTEQRAYEKALKLICANNAHRLLQPETARRLTVLTAKLTQCASSLSRQR